MITRDILPGSREAWLRGPVAGVPPLLGPVAHALIQAVEDLRNAMADLPPELLWVRPGGAASIGFHLGHLAGSLDRLFTYARGEPLTREQKESLLQEQQPRPAVSVEELLSQIDQVVARALVQLRNTPESLLLEFRGVGRAQAPSNVLGLLCHAAEHTQRHTGQVITTAKILRGTTGRPTA